jgi:signal transduction histidine kinase
MGASDHNPPRAGPAGAAAAGPVGVNRATRCCGEAHPLSSQEQAAPSPVPGRRSGLFRRFVVSYCLLLVVLWVPLFVLADVRMSQGLREQARARGLAIARSLAALSQPSLVAYDTLAVAQGAARAKRQSGLTDVVVFDKEGRIAAHTEAGWLQGQPPAEPELQRAAATPVMTVSEVEMAPADAGGRPVPGLEIVVPVYLDEGSSEKWGAVRVRMSTEEIHARIRSTRLGLLGLGLLALAVGVVGSFIMARRITRPLSGLVAGALRAAGGDLQSRIDVHTGDEIEELAGSFNHLVEEVEQKQRAIAELNRGLEEKVRIRTEDLTQAKGALERAYEELSQAEMNLIHSEKMASLGQLVAGIAHEINTPSSAIGAAVYNLADDLRALPGQVRLLVDEGLPAAESEPLFALISRALTPAEGGRRSSTADIRQRTRGLETSLSEAGLASPRELALTFTRLGLADELQALAARGPLGPAGAAFLENAGHLALAVQDVRLSIGTITRLVKALKGYSQLDQAEMTEADVHDGIETTLTILRSQIRYGIAVERRYATVPPVTANVHELNQVWTNLIHNALQAMGGSGRLTIETWQEDSFVGVRITDSGPGIPEGIRGRIFDPFFTTKDQGEGTGLGLGIARQIIQRHHGQIRLDSQPGRTSFEVRLPTAPVAREAGA